MQVASGTSMLARSALTAALSLAVVILATGCDTEKYSADIRYPIRSDPIIVKTPTNESAFPDRPGTLPVLSFKNLEDPTNPLHPMLKEGAPLNPALLGAQDRADFLTTLQDMFGTPADPKVEGTADPDLVKTLQQEFHLTKEHLAEGSRLYRMHCLHCHGLTGDGRGPTAFWINPHPRDYRRGAYKFVSTSVEQGQQQRPRVEDLVRTVVHGLDGTAMPAFSTLTDKETQQIIAYVIHLGLRGEVEQFAMKDFLEAKPGERDWTDNKEKIQGWLPTVARFWLSSQKKGNVQSIVIPDAYPYTTDEEFAQSVQRGWKVFATEKDKGGGDCLKCHADYGRKSLFRFDEWGTMVRPADLTLGIYRGGRRPVDLYWRIHNGITGSGMVRSPDFRPTDKEKGEKVDRLWDLVNFLQVLPYPKMREKYGIQIN